MRIQNRQITMIDNPLVKLLTGLLAALGAVNWGLVEFADYDILTDLLSLSQGSTEMQLVVGLIAVSGLIVGYLEVMWFQEEV